MTTRPGMPSSALPRGATVSKSGDGWAVKGVTGPTSGVFDTKAEAMAAAKAALVRQGGTLSVESANGRITQTLTLGRDTAVRLNGIEGVAMNTASRRVLREVQASGLTSKQQLGAIVAAFKK